MKSRFQNFYPTQKSLRLAATILITALLSVNTFADRVGNNGKLAFQKLVDENVGMDEFEVLTLAFSKGSLPTRDQFEARVLPTQKKISATMSHVQTNARIWQGTRYVKGQSSLHTRPSEMYTGISVRGPVFPVEFNSSLYNHESGRYTDEYGPYLHNTPSIAFKPTSDGRSLSKQIDFDNTIEIRSYHGVLIAITKTPNGLCAAPDEYAYQGICSIYYFYDFNR